LPDAATSRQSQYVLFYTVVKIEIFFKKLRKSEYLSIHIDIY